MTEVSIQWSGIIRWINVNRPAAQPTTLPITLMPQGILICFLSKRVTGNNIQERRSWKGLLINAINDESIDCCKVSDGSSYCSVSQELFYLWWVEKFWSFLKTIYIYNTVGSPEETHGIDFLCKHRHVLVFLCVIIADLLKHLLCLSLFVLPLS